MNIIETSIKWNGTLNYSNKPDTIILHHAEASNCSIADIDRWHKLRGWAGVGYHYFVKKDGTIFRGRPEGAAGAHTKGYNTHSVGICAEGAYMKEEMPEIQRKSIIALGEDIKLRYDINHIYGHREVYATACPGNNYPLAQIKAAIMSEFVAKDEPVEKTWLQVGDEGTDVKNLQQKLKELGYYSDDIDSNFGKITKAAVMKFQKDNGLEADGLVGTQTMAILNKAKIVPFPGYQFKYNPKKFDSNVKLIQEKLNNLGFNCGKADGYFGDKTLKAVTSYQKVKLLKVDGIVGTNTWNKLF